MRGASGRGASRAKEKGASRLARAGVLEQYVEHGKQAQRSPGARIACFDRRVVRHAGQCPRSARTAVPAPRSLLACALWRGMGGYGAAWAAWGAPSRCPRTIRASNRAIRVFTNHETRLLPGARRGVPSGPARIPRFSRNTKQSDDGYESTIRASNRAKSGFSRDTAIANHGALFTARHGRLWRGMGGMGRPEPLSAHHPRQQQGHSGFHETRDTAIAWRAARGFSDGFHETHETRDTNHGLCCGAAWAAMARHGRHIAPAPASLPRPPFSVASRRSPQFPSPSGLMRQWPMPKEPTSRKENVPDCTNRGTFVIALTLPG